MNNEISRETFDEFKANIVRMAKSLLPSAKEREDYNELIAIIGGYPDTIEWLITKISMLEYPDLEGLLEWQDYVVEKAKEKGLEAGKEKLKVRFENADKVNKDFVSVSAAKYGFEDLVIVPYIDLGKTEDGMIATAKFPREMADEIVPQIDKVVEETEYEITNMNDMMREMALADGMPEELADALFGGAPAPMWVVTNKAKLNGAISVVAAKDALRNMFPNGYVVLPSSRHEVLVLDINSNNNIDELKEMVTEINLGVVSEDDKLSDNVYVFTA